jgi:MFS transporter, SP family, sugar:H+ symporter
MFATEQVGRKWSLIVGGLGQAFAMYYIGIHAAIDPTKASSSDAATHLTSSGTFAIVCVYLFVVFYSFGWGPIPFVLCAECSPNHLRSLVMALSLMTQWLFNFVIAKITPIMLADITYGTFLLFGTLCILMTIFAVVCVPETKNIPLESIHVLFEKNIIRGCIKDTVPRHSRAKTLQKHSAVLGDMGSDFGEGNLKKDELHV